MTCFEIMKLPARPDIAAPDDMAHFELPPGQTTQAVTHRTVGENWGVVGGRGAGSGGVPGTPDS